MSNPNVVLVGNGPYANRGCEAIVRGTMEILRAAFGELRVSLGSFGSLELVEDQKRNEIDPAITHFPLNTGLKLRRWSLGWFVHRGLKTVCRSATLNYRALAIQARDADVVLEIGGDNYSLDYGIPYNFMAIDRFFFNKQIPVVLWGASVGPFDQLPHFKKRMLEHLKRMKLVFVRESVSYEYLVSNSLGDNVRLMADPAFVMKPEQPDTFNLPVSQLGELIGLSLSPLMARYITNGNLTEWKRQSANILAKILKAEPNRTVVLVPHVINPFNVWANDYAFFRDILASLSPEEAQRTILLPPLNAAEFKWVIGQCKVFVGARTHSTIAAFSQCIPTVSLAYSTKAIGLNRDLLGSMDYCLLPDETTPGAVVERMRHALRNAEAISQELQAKMHEVTNQAYAAGHALRGILS